MKRPILIAAALVTTVALSGGVMAYHTQGIKKPVPAKSIELTETVTPAAPVTTTPTPTVQPAPTDTTTTTTTTQQTASQSTPSKTTAALQAEAETRINTDTNNPYQYGCFDRVIAYRYNWNISETEMLHRIDNIEQLYTSFCSAWGVVQKTPLTSPVPPPGFRD